MFALFLFLLFRVCMMVTPWLTGISLGEGMVSLGWELSPGIAVRCGSPVGYDGPSGLAGVYVLSDCVLLMGGGSGPSSGVVNLSLFGG